MKEIQDDNVQKNGRSATSVNGMKESYNNSEKKGKIKKFNRKAALQRRQKLAAIKYFPIFFFPQSNKRLSQPQMETKQRKIQEFEN